MTGHDGTDVQRSLLDAVVVERATGAVMQSRCCAARTARETLEREAALAGRELADHCERVLAGVGERRDVQVLLPGRPPGERLVAGDPQQVQERLALIDGTPARISPPPSGGGLGLRHTDTDVVRIGEALLPGELRLDSDGTWGVVAELLAGSAEPRTEAVRDRFSAGDVFLLGGPGVPYVWRTVDARVRTVAVPLSLLCQVTDGMPDRTRPVRFTGVSPAAPALAQQWRATAACLIRLLDAGEAAAPWVVTNAARLAAAVLLSVFPNTLLPADTGSGDRAPRIPAGVRQAVDFMGAHAGRELTVGDIAQAAHVTPRALQYAFRRHLGTTPLGYLREIRLRRAHDDLLAADPATETVTGIAFRWGFASPGRFAALYRGAYGCAPRATLAARATAAAP